MVFTESGPQHTKILLVDRDSDVHRYVGPVLKFDGYQVLSAYDGAGALEACDGCELIILCDHLADMTAGELVRALQHKGSKAPILYVITPQPGGGVSGSPTGVAAVMCKPLNGPLMLRKIAELLLPPEEEDTELDAQLQALCQEYIQIMVSQIQRIDQAMIQLQQDPNDENSFREAVVFAHRIRGTAGSYGFHEAGHEAGRLEDLLKALDRQGLAPDWMPVLDALAKTRTAVTLIAQATQTV